MQLRRTILAVTLLAAIIVLAYPYPARTQGDSPQGLSPYWNTNVIRWESLILPAAQQRNVDPDLIAAVIWKESLGRAWERGPVGAVGLMGIMPFEWRPSEEELENPWVNLAWGTRALAHTIRDGKGDVYYALAAYNGGWDKIHHPSTRNYAADVLKHYVLAVAVRYELPVDDNWIAIIAVDKAPIPKTVTVIGPQRPLARYTERRWVQADIPKVPVDVPPHSNVITFVDEYGLERRVDMWLVAADGSPLLPSASQISSASSPIGVSESQNPTPTPLRSPSPTPPLSLTPTGMVPSSPRSASATVRGDGADLRPGASAWWYPVQSLPTGTSVELLGYDPAFPEWVYIRTIDGASTGWVRIVDLDTAGQFQSLPKITPVPTLTPTPLTTAVAPTLTLTTTLPLTPSVECAGGPLQLDAWDLAKELTLEGGWTATVYLQGYGGDCIYVYAWEGEVKHDPTSESVTFQLSHTDRFGVIIGTASVTSAGETVEVGLFLRPP